MHSELLTALSVRVQVRGVTQLSSRTNAGAAALDAQLARLSK
ncbi:hypothetical protein Z947_3474 [Sulfitobacter geojensis]|nr:hypothetical protein Z947_3474 [Sulfitobacter geojensis]